MLLKYDDVLFLAGDWGHDVARIANTLIAGHHGNYADVTARIIAVLGMFQVPGRRSQATASDLFARGTLPSPVSEECGDCQAFLRDDRMVRWEDELTSLLDTGAVTVT